MELDKAKEELARQSEEADAREAEHERVATEEKASQHKKPHSTVIQP